MKILHTADWHLGKRLDQFSRHAEQVAVLDEICAIADRENVDAVIIAGDLFDTFNPPTESVALFYQVCKRLTNNGLRPVVAIAGNHDSPERVESADPLAQACGIILVGFPKTVVTPFAVENGFAVVRSDAGFLEIKLPHFEYPMRLLLTPFANEYRLATYLGTDNEAGNLRTVLAEHWQRMADQYLNPTNEAAYTEGVNILVTHQFVMEKNGLAPEEPDDEKPINVGGTSAIFTENFPSAVQYVALGHLHRQQIIQSAPVPVLYSGSILAYSFAEENQEKYVMVLNAEPRKTVDFQRVKLDTPKKLMAVRFDDSEAALRWLAENPDVLVNLTLVTDDYPDPLVLRQLYAAHAGIVPPIALEVRNLESAAGANVYNPHTEDMRALFQKYFQVKHKNQEPNAALMALFDEVRAVELDD